MILGSASYLCCDELKEASLKLQDAGHAVISNIAPVPTMNDIKALFDDYCICLSRLEKEVSSTKK